MSNNKPICVQTPKLTEAEQQSIKALSRGDATPHQQNMALKVIVNKLCRADDLLYIPNSFDETAFLQGRGFVGQRIMKIIKQPLNSMNEDSSNEDR